MCTNPISPQRAILLTTPASATDPRRHLGSADYSYGFVDRALRPVFEAIGTVHLVDRPESRLSWATASARAKGLDAVHVSLCPLHASYLPRDVPTVCFPFWEFPHVPDRDFGHDTRQNWVRIARSARRIVCACRFTAQAFREACPVPIDVIPVPIDARSFDLPAWERSSTLSIECRHLVLGPDWVQSSHARAPEPHGISGRVRRLYNHRVRPLLSREALERMKGVRRALLRMPDLPPRRLPVTQLELKGLTYLSVFNFSDRRKNARDMLTGFLLAFRDRPDATLIWKLVTNRDNEADELDQVRRLHASLGIPHRCRIVVITDFLDDGTLAGLYQASTYYINTSRAEGACLPLQQALASGTPAIAPACSAMADYMDDEVGFLVEYSSEPAYWPHDPEKRVETTWARLSWSSLRDCLQRSAHIADTAQNDYRRLSENARRRMRPFGDIRAIAAEWCRVIDAA